MTTLSSIEEAAARWHARMADGPLSPHDERQLDAWLAENVRHRLAYADVAATGFAFDQVLPRVAVAVVRARRWPIWIGATAAPLLLFLLVVFAPRAWQDWRSDGYTAVGARRVQTLADGSILRLDTDSAVSLPFARDHRDVELLRGALSVEVAKDAAHPFRVHCAGVEATAVGTQFTVVRRADEIEIGVIEGIVAVRVNGDASPGSVDPLHVVAGQRVLVDLQQRSLRSESLPAISYGWTRGVLSFEHTPLKEAISELARYLPEHVVFRATGHSGTPVTATFPVDQPDAALLAIAQANGLTVRHVAGLVTIVEDR